VAEISDAELTTIENTLVTIRDALSQDNSPEAASVKQMIVEAEQIISGKLDAGGGTGAPQGTNQSLSQAQTVA
jgi:hypothetical protein